MRIIRIAAGADGSRPPIQTWTGDTLPQGYAWLPEELDDGCFETANGFVSLEVDADGTVTTMAEDAAAREAWLAGQTEEELHVPDLQETTLELLADHEYRLCLLELGVTE